MHDGASGLILFTLDDTRLAASPCFVAFLRIDSLSPVASCSDFIFARQAKVESCVSLLN